MNGSATTLATPISPVSLLEQVRCLGQLLDSLGSLLQLGLPPGLETLKQNVLLAVERPEALETPENQLDFVEEFAVALWGEPFPDFLGAGEGSLGASPEARGRSPVEATWEELDRISQLLCRDVERWHRRRALAASRRPSAAMRSPV